MGRSLLQLKEVLSCHQKAELKANAKKSFFGRHELEHLVGYWITCGHKMPILKKVQAIQGIATPTTKKQQCRYIVMSNNYCNMWTHRSETLAL